MSIARARREVVDFIADLGTFLEKTRENCEFVTRETFDCAIVTVFRLVSGQ